MRTLSSFSPIAPLALAALLSASSAARAQGATEDAVTPTPAPTAVPTAPPTQESAPAPAAPEAAPAPAVPATPPVPGPVDYNARVGGGIDSLAGLRVGVAIGGHLFLGEGWNEENGGVEQKTEDYPGVAYRAFAFVNANPSFAGGLSIGTHSGTHSGPDPLATGRFSINYAVYFFELNGRLQTPPSRLGGYVELGAGGFVAARSVVRTSDDTDVGTDANWTGHGAAGLTFYLTKGVDLCLETRWATAPAKFHSGEPVSDLGGVTVSGGVLVRL